MFVDQVSKIEQKSFRVSEPTATNLPYLRPITHLHHLLANQNRPLLKERPSSLFTNEKKLLKTTLGKYSNQLGNTHQHVHHYCREFMDGVGKQLASNNTINTYHAAKQHIAQVAFLATKQPDTVLQHINSIHPVVTIRAKVQEEIAQIKSKLDHLMQTHVKVGLQSPEMAYFVAFHLEIFKALMLPEGVLNVNLIPDLIKGLLDDTALDVNWKKETKSILEKIHNSKEIPNKITELKKPRENNELSKRIIRLTLDIPPENEITDRDTKIAGCAGMIPVRQGPVGNCFVICNAIWFVLAVLEKTVSDFSQILETGTLLRKQNEMSIIYPIDFDIADGDLDKSFHVKSGGELQGGAFLWESPGFQSACLQLRLSDSKSSILEALKLLVKNKNELDTTPREVLSLLAILSLKNSDESLEELQKLAYQAFSSKTNMPILHAWISGLAAMDQSTTSSSLHKKLNNCWTATFSDTWNQLNLEEKQHENIVKKIQKIFDKQINGRMLIEYDESVQTPLSADGSSTAGAFVYFENDLDAPMSAAQPLHSWKDLNRYALNTLKATENQLIKDNSGTDITVCTKVAKKIEQFVTSGDKFADLVFANYDETLKEGTLDEKWEKFKAFGEIGGDNVNVFEKAMGFPLPPPVQAKEATAKERFIVIIKFLRSRESVDHFVVTPENERYEMDSDDHAFSLPTDTPSLLPFIKTDEDIATLLEHRMVKPCKTVSEAEITTVQKNQVIENSLRFVPKELDVRFKAEVQNIKEHSIHTYTKSVFDLIVKLTPDMQGDEAKKSSLLAKFTNMILYRVLTDAQFKVIREATVLGPDTNWVDDDQQNRKLLEIFFAFTLNPVTNEIEFFEIDEDSSGLYALSQADWIGGPWDMYAYNIYQKTV